MPEQKFECRGCCKYPHGKWSILLSVFACLAWIFTLIATSTCRFVIHDYYGGYGAFNYEGYDGCYAYDSGDRSYFDGGIKAARTFSMIATIFGFFIMIIGFVGGCMSFPPITFKIIGGTCAVLSVCCLLTLTVFASDVACGDDYYYGNGGCRVGGGAACAIIAFFLWVIAAVFAFITKEAHEQEPPVAMTTTDDGTKPDIKDATPGTVTVTEETLPDGSVKTTKTTMNPDGTRTITESIDGPPTETAPSPRREEPPMPPVATVSPLAASMPAAKVDTTSAPMPPTSSKTKTATIKNTRPVIYAD